MPTNDPTATPTPGGDREMIHHIKDVFDLVVGEKPVPEDATTSMAFSTAKRLVSLATEALSLRKRVRKLEQQLEDEKDEYQGAAHDAARLEERCKELEAENEQLRADAEVGRAVREMRPETIPEKTSHGTWIIEYRDPQGEMLCREKPSPLAALKAAQGGEGGPTL